MILKYIPDRFTASQDFSVLKESGFKTPVEGIAPSSFPVIIASIFNDSPEITIVVTETSQKMQELYLDLLCMVDQDCLFQLPSWETLPYEYVSPSEKIERDRITARYRILTGEPAVIITTVESLMRKIPAREFLANKGVTLSVNDEYPFDDIIEMLVLYGYSRESRVEAFGQFCVKGGIIDVFLPSNDNPVRFDFFGDTLEAIREFDINSQISSSRLDSVTIYPRKELILFKKEKEKIYSVLEQAEQDGLELSDEMRDQVTNMEITGFSGIEDLFPLVIESSDILSYLDEKTRIIFLENPELISRKKLLENTFAELYKKYKQKRLCLEPDKLLETDAFDRASEKALHIQTFTTSRGALNWSLRSVPNFQGKIKSVREEISKKIEDGWKIIITTGFDGQARRLFDLLSEFKPDSNFEKIDPELNLNIVISPYSEGMEISSIKLLILSDHEIFGKSYRKKKQFKKKKSRPIESFLDLKIEDYVVHINHGIGIFKGIERMSAGGVERDFLMIEYADGDKLYVSLDQITMVQKYIGLESRKPRVDNLGKKSSWNKIKTKVKEAVEEIAKDLIKIYSTRDTQKGYQFPPDTLWQEEFEALFEFEETPDQITAIEDVKDDMENPTPMDRLICGDVGFGKTEVAIRASFKAVMAGRQVAILVPTTVLAMQHFSNFKKRFEEYPIEIEMMSRFRTRGEITEIKGKLNEGKVDIVIGTHALISKDVKIKNLGLLIIDEEQKFGVRHKERLKQFRTLVDVLTLSATPIPRTLHMSMAGIRDMSTITTPPENRQAIETYVLEENPDILRRAILNEIERNGQVFFIHNRVQTIDAVSVMLEDLIPEASYCVAHGQMNENELEEIMVDFLDRKFDVIISTTIIESGLDIPNVNTIIINRADTFGLSQLYQLKGRVGRSNRKAFAYLFYPRHVPLSEEAQKRLQVISEYSELGSGLKVAMKDLEIRGSGNILGKEQSGSIMEVGFDLYCQMLDDAVKNLKGEKGSSVFRTPVFINSDFFIPDAYINDQRQKIEFYKRFESCDTEEEVDSLSNELLDRFGPVPNEVEILIELQKIRTIASSVYIDEILEDSKSIRIKISKDAKIEPVKLLEIITKDRRISIDPNDTEIVVFNTSGNEVEKKLADLKKWLQQIS